jgi:hypothetical protein
MVIETTTAQALVERIRQVEDRLGRLLTSGWRQAPSEVADLRPEADALADDGLTELAARISAVVGATSAAEALPAIALAVSACRLLRVRLLADAAPDEWVPLRPPKPQSGAAVDTLLPMARLLLEGREVWACARPARYDWLLLEPPLPLPEVPGPAAEAASATGLLARLGRQLTGALVSAETPPGPWIRHRLRGRLVWQARYPLGAHSDVAFCTVDRPEWVTDDAETNRHGIHAFHYTLSDRILIPGAPVFPMGGPFKLVELERDDPAAYVWLDPTAADVLAAAPTEKVWAIAWIEGRAIVPIVLIERGGRAQPSWLTHLIPGAPRDRLWRPT